MMTKDKRVLVISFEEAIGKIVDQFLNEGLGTHFIKQILHDEAKSDLEMRRDELKREKAK